MKKLFFIIFITINIYANDAFIKPLELKNSLGDKNLVIVDVSSDYEKSHIVDALSFNVDALTHTKGYNALIQKDEIEELLRELGINNSSKVVIYGRNTDIDIKNSTFLAFVLISHGFVNVSILDGGYMAWVFEYDILTSVEDTEIEVEDANLSLKDTNISVGYDYIKNNKNILLVDARYPQKYYGISDKDDDNYLGHIPKAKNSHYAYKFLKDKSLRSQDELNEIYIDGLGLGAKKDIVVYADNAKDASVEWYIIYSYMGFKDAKLYYNSYYEYVEWDFKTERFKWE
jgi:thiosulfate/3-mercaptopyruvate sulfurtransferase